MSTWLLVANGSEARLFETEARPKTLKLLQSFEHQESREKGADLNTDRAGMYRGDTATGRGTIQGSMAETTDPKEHEMQRFALKLVDVLEQGRTANHFDNLIIASSPKFHGILNQKMNGQLEKLVDRHINKDLTSFSEVELLDGVLGDL